MDIDHGGKFCFSFFVNPVEKRKISYFVLARYLIQH